MKNDISLKDEFEIFLTVTYTGKTFNLETFNNNQKGMYIDNEVKLLYSAFKRSYRDARKFFLNKTKTGTYRKYGEDTNVIATVHSGRIIFSETPYVHKTVEEAQTEAERLSEKHKGKFLVFTLATSHTYKPPAIFANTVVKN